MGQQVNVYEDLVFRGRADYQSNVKGNVLPEKVILHDHFIQDNNATYHWTESASYGCTIAHGVTRGGTTTLTTGSTQYDCGELSHSICWHPDKNCTMEARIQVDYITNVAINVGWTDGVQAADNEICFELGSSATAVDSRATDGAAFVFDTDGGTSYWYTCAVNNDEEATPVSIAESPVADTYETLRVALDATGNATFYRNGNRVGYMTSAVQYDAAADVLTPYVAVMAQSTQATVLTIDRITCWQDE